jgi:hypothetical protein
MTDLLDRLVRAVGPEGTLLILLMALLILAWLVPLFCLRRVSRKVKLLEQQIVHAQDRLTAMNRFQLTSRVQGRQARRIG